MSSPVFVALLMLQAQPAPPAAPPATTTTAAAPARPSTDGEAVVSTEPQAALEPEPRVRPFEMPPAPPAAPTIDPAHTPDVPAPVKVEDYQRSYEGPTDAIEAYYDTGVRRAFEAEQALHGALDGEWIVSTGAGSPLLSLVLVDSGKPNEPLAGAWRDLSKGPSPEASGLLEKVVRDSTALVVTFRSRDGAPPLTLRLSPGPGGRWRGLLQDETGARPVVMDRRGL